MVFHLYNQPLLHMNILLFCSDWHPILDGIHTSFTRTSSSPREGSDFPHQALLTCLILLLTPAAGTPCVCSDAAPWHCLCPPVWITSSFYFAIFPGPHGTPLPQINIVIFFAWPMVMGLSFFEKGKGKLITILKILQ